MFDEAKLNKYREFFSNDKYATKVTGCEIVEMDEGYAKVSLKVTEDHRNAYGGIMGGAIFTVADFASAAAINQDGKATLAINVNINYVGNTKEDEIFAIAKVVKNGRSTAYSEVQVVSASGKPIAYATVTGFHMN